MKLPLDLGSLDASSVVTNFGRGTELFAALDHAQVWAHIPHGRPSTASELASRLTVPNRQPLLVIRGSEVVGTSSYLADPAHTDGIEIGATLLTPTVWGTGVNALAKRVMIAAAFEQGAQWVQLRTDERNHRSAAAILKLPGAVEADRRREPAIHRPDGTVRTSRVFRIDRP